jgi:hypothetical protein
MKVLLINGSPRHSCTYTALAEMQKVFEEGLAGLRVVAENMVFLMKSIAKGKEEFGMPAPPVRVKTNYIR